VIPHQIRYAARRLVTKFQERKNKEDKLKVNIKTTKGRFIREIKKVYKSTFLSIFFLIYLLIKI